VRAEEEEEEEEEEEQDQEEEEEEVVVVAEEVTTTLRMQLLDRLQWLELSRLCGVPRCRHPPCQRAQRRGQQHTHSHHY
jgi:hypothetical protein